ncbi:MAG: alanine dehydrogenase [Myxococcota bacterium]|nr:alanine dehydrogenase [Myxococcota bacterium]
MEFSLIRERADNEARVALTPVGVRVLVEDDHDVVVESGAGEAAGFSDDDYKAVGAQIAFSAFEAARAGEVLVKVRAPRPDELDLITPDSTLLCFMHLAGDPHGLLQRLTGSGSTGVALELIERNGRRPVMDPLSAIGGRLAITMVQHHLTRLGGGPGQLISGSPGVPPVRICVVGGGQAGLAAAQAAQAMGAEVAILEVDPGRLMELHERLRGVVTVGATRWNLAKYMGWADVVIGAVARRGLPTPKVLTRNLVRSMSPGNLLVDLSIDEGGCAETSRPSSVDEPVYEAEGVRHLCIPNLPSLVARSASESLSIGITPLCQALGRGMRQAVQRAPELIAATQVFEGELCCDRVALEQGVRAQSLTELLGLG